MQCNELHQILEREEPLPAGAAAHLDECRRCRALLEDVETIQAVARQLGAEPVEPPERVWLDLRAQLEAEGLIRTPGRAGASLGWLEGLLAGLQRPAVAGALLSLVVAAAVLVGVRDLRRPSPPSQAQQTLKATQALRAQLSTVERRAVSEMHQHNPAAVASLRQNLDVVDNLIALCENSVRENPQDEMAREYLYGAYQQKAELLSLVMDRETLGD